MPTKWVEMPSNKEKERKEKESKITLSHTHEGDLFPKDDVFEKSLDECFEEIKSSQISIQEMHMCFYRKDKGITEKDIISYLEEFFDMQKAKGIAKKSVKDGKDHFVNWLNLKLEKEKHKNGKRNSKNRGGDIIPGPAMRIEESPRTNIVPSTNNLEEWINGLSIGE